MAYIGNSWCFFAFPYLLQARRSKQEGKRERGTKGNGRTREERTSVESKRGVQGLKERAKAGFAAPDAPAQCSHSLGGITQSFSLDIIQSWKATNPLGKLGEIVPDGSTMDVAQHLLYEIVVHFFHDSRRAAGPNKCSAHSITPQRSSRTGTIVTHPIDTIIDREPQ